MKRLQNLTIAAAVMTAIQIGIGALVRATKSGLGCGNDWPHCHGKFLPRLDSVNVAIEFSHRVAASLVVALVTILAIYAWLKFRPVKTIFWPCFLALVLVFAQGGIGGLVVVADLTSIAVVLHFVVASALLALLVYTAVNSFRPKGGAFDPVSRHGLVALGAVGTVLVVGAFVSQFHAALVYPDWPLVNGGVFPSGGALGWLHYGHRIAAALLGITLIHLSIRVTQSAKRERALVMLAHSMSLLWAVQVAFGALNVFTRSEPWAIVAHVTTSAILWAMTVAFATLSYRISPAQDRATSSQSERLTPIEASNLDKAKAYFMLTKPRIIELLLITTVPAMVIAGKGHPSWWLIISTLFGGSLTAGSANSINCYVDRDIDEKMPRTAGRPLPLHQVDPRAALRFGIVLGIAGFGWLAALVNLLSAVLATSAILFYVFVYTIGMKRRTPSNIVIGGAAGAVPVLVGWAAVTGGLSAPAWILFAIVFYWTPPHFWALSLRHKDEYAAAGIPMLPVVHGVAETTRQILLYSFVLIATSLLLYPVAHMGTMYLLVACILGPAFAFFAIRLRRWPTPRSAMALFHFSLTYLVLLFVGAAIDRALAAPSLTWLYAPVSIVAAALFITFETAIVASVARYRKGSRIASELAWTTIPILAIAALFTVSWPNIGIAVPK
ncbi:MAG: heme o synthase [Actinobacteria bacterium]|nr:heme o synthase [Actinomycetota bacterium]